jgi:hypothetical protein
MIDAIASVHIIITNMVLAIASVGFVSERVRPRMPLDKFSLLRWKPALYFGGLS